MPRRGIGLERLVLPERSEGRRSRLSAAFSPSEARGEHRFHLAFHCPMILLNHIVKIFALSDDDAGLVDAIIPVNGCRIAATLVDRDLFWEPVDPNRFV